MSNLLRSRRSLRLPCYDYGSAGYYFVTVCTYRKRFLLGQVRGETMILSRLGETVAACWRDIPQHFPHVELDIFVVMPNHLHGLLYLGDSVRHQGRSREADNRQFGESRAGSLGRIIGAFKAAATKRARHVVPLQHLWQRNYWEHVVRTEASLERLRDYIVTNPLRWELDSENPGRRSRA